MMDGDVIAALMLVAISAIAGALITGMAMASVDAPPDAPACTLVLGQAGE